MDIVLEPVKKEEKEILRNLMEKYRYEFSQYDDLDTKFNTKICVVYLPIQ